jgi:ketosteroid isomerase-like protein
MSLSTRTLVQGFYEAVGEEVTDSFSGERMVELSELLSGHVSDDFECVMVGPGGPESYPGLDGFARAWQDWVSPYTSFSVEIEEMIELPEAVLMPVRQRGVTRHDGVPIENSGASVWWFRGDQLERAEFYLDRDAAYAAAGVEPGA